METLAVFTVELEPGDKFSYNEMEFEVIELDPLFRYIEYKDITTGAVHDGVFANGHQSLLIVKN